MEAIDRTLKGTLVPGRDVVGDPRAAEQMISWAERDGWVAEAGKEERRRSMLTYLWGDPPFRRRFRINMPFALDTRNSMERFLGNHLKEIIVIKRKFRSKNIFHSETGGMCWRCFLARIKKIMREGNASLRMAVAKGKRELVAIWYRWDVLALMDRSVSWRSWFGR